MKRIGRIVAHLLFCINVFLIGMLILSAYSGYIHPTMGVIAACIGLAFPLFLIVNLCFAVFWIFVRRRYALLPLIGFLICIPQIQTYFPLHVSTKTVPEGSLKILSYNVMSFALLQKANGRNPILSYLVNSHADIICLQEYRAGSDKNFLTEQDILEALKAYPYYSIHCDGMRAPLACFSKFPILSAQAIPYESTFNGSIAYTLNVNGDTIMLINNHLESNKLTYEERGIYEMMIDDPDTQKMKSGIRQLAKKLAEASVVRAEQAEIVARYITESPYPTVLACGDFNDASLSYTHRILTEHLNDAFTMSGCGAGISYNQNKFYFRIDNILVSPNLETFNCTVDRSIKDSDHYPIWCYVQKK